MGARHGPGGRVAMRDMPKDMAGLPPCNVSALRPGDIGFYYAPHTGARHRSFKQWMIGVGQRCGRWAHPGTGGDSRMLHAYIVLQVFPGRGRVLVADASKDEQGRCGVACAKYDLTRKTRHSPGGTHLYYRFKDPRLAQAVRDRAEAWGRQPSDNFSSSRAAMAPFRCWSVFSGARRHIRHLIAHPPALGAVPRLYGRGAYPLTCSNFVSSVCVPEIMALYCRDQGLPARVTPTTLMALKEGSAGRIFHADPRWMLPSTLQAGFAASRAATAVGAIRAF